jgi:hypothetical protein
VPLGVKLAPPPPAKYLKVGLGPGVPIVGLGLIAVPAPFPPGAPFPAVEPEEVAPPPPPPSYGELHPPPGFP